MIILMKTLIFTLIGLRKCCMKSQFFNRGEQNSDELFASVQVVHLCFKFCCIEYCKNDSFRSYDYLEFICFWPSKFKPSALKKNFRATAVVARLPAWAVVPFLCSPQGGRGGPPCHIGKQKVGTYTYCLLYTIHWASGSVPIMELYSC
jgi:hypothetical protein